MPPRHRTCVERIGLVLSCSFVLLVATDCRKEQTEKKSPPPSRAPGVPTPNPIPQTPARSAKAARSPDTAGVDGRDDPRAPVCLPKSLKVDQWVKHEPVRVVGPDALADVMSRDEATRLAHFAVRSAARCAYVLSRGDGRTTQARVLVVEAASVDDAYGLLTCQSTARETSAIGGETRIERREGLHLHCWQGRSYIHVWSPRAAANVADQMLQLLRYIAGHLQREDPPELLEAMPRDRQAPGRRWLLRDLGSLPAGALSTAPALDWVRVNELLGLGDDTLMCLASYATPEARRPNLVWLVRYPSALAASQAHDRYARALARATGPAWESTNLMRPRGAFLIGTWTAEEESLQYMMPRIKQLLPS